MKYSGFWISCVWLLLSMDPLAAEVSSSATESENFASDYSSEPPSSSESTGTVSAQSVGRFASLSVVHTAMDFMPLEARTDSMRAPAADIIEACKSTLKNSLRGMAVDEIEKCASVCELFASAPNLCPEGQTNPFKLAGCVPYYSQGCTLKQGQFQALRAEQVSADAQDEDVLKKHKSLEAIEKTVRRLRGMRNSRR